MSRDVEAAAAADADQGDGVPHGDRQSPQRGDRHHRGRYIGDPLACLVSLVWPGGKALGW